MICKSWVSRWATRLALWAMLKSLPVTRRSTAPWTTYHDCAINSLAWVGGQVRVNPDKANPAVWASPLVNSSSLAN